jgi:hypothetical protein
VQAEAVAGRLRAVGASPADIAALMRVLHPGYR